MANRRNYAVNIAGRGAEGRPPAPLVETANNLYARYAWRSSSDNVNRKKPVGWVAPTNYSMEEGSYQCAFGTCLLADGWYQTGYLPNRLTPVARLDGTLTRLRIPATFPAALQNRVVSDVRLKAKDQKFNAAQALAEQAQTAELVGGTIIAVAGAVRDLYHGKPGPAIDKLLRRLHQRGLRREAERLAKKAARKLPNAVLAVQYGVRPLAQDCFGVVAALDKQFNGVPITTVKSKVQETYHINEYWANTSSYGNSHHATGQVFYGAMARLDMSPSFGAIKTAAELGFTNPAQLAWELVPFSFVVDWFLPLGDYFSQLDGLVGCEVKGYSVSLLTKIRVRWTGWDPPGANRQSAWISHYNRTTLSRGASLTVPFAKFPSFKNPLGRDHVLNALSLLAKAARGK